MPWFSVQLAKNVKMSLVFLTCDGNAQTCYLRKKYTNLERDSVTDPISEMIEVVLLGFCVFWGDCK